MFKLCKMIFYNFFQYSTENNVTDIIPILKVLKSLVLQYLMYIKDMDLLVCGFYGLFKETKEI